MTQLLTKGNPAEFNWALTDNDGVTPLTDLSTATEILFHARVAGQDGPGISPDLELTLSGEGAQFDLDDPVTGSLKVRANNADMALSPEEYDTFLQVTRSTGQTLEYANKVSDTTPGGFQIREEGVTG